MKNPNDIECKWCEENTLGGKLRVEDDGNGNCVACGRKLRKYWNFFDVTMSTPIIFWNGVSGSFSYNNAIEYNSMVLGRWNTSS